ncbi:MAG TPA: methyltransferase domain-containing protein [Steroidobacteraceae bacterium]|nr:methyltransferase domain-containing protein [Steroidobacteraceae bacterium]
MSQPVSWCVLTLLLLASAPPADAASRDECERQYKPQTGQPGKDVIWVATDDGLVARMLKMARVTAGDVVYDLGAGDGKIAIAAARDFGAHAIGVEYDPHLARLAQCYVQADGLGERVQIRHGDIFETDFSSATVVTLYLMPELNLRLRPTILKMQPGTRVVSHSFLMGDWEPDERSMTDDGNAYLWIVPAQVEGTWSFRETDGNGHFAVQLEQRFQYLSGRAESEPVSNARLHGSQLELTFLENGTPTKISGEVAGDRIDAQVTRGGKTARYAGTR